MLSQIIWSPWAKATPSCSLYFLFLHPNTFSNNLFFKILATVQEHGELILLAGNLKLELIEYSQ